MTERDCFFQDQWYRQIPALHSVLRGDDVTSSALALDAERHSYWFAALYLCRIILGWNASGDGVRKVLSEPALEGPVKLLPNFWAPDERLQAFGAWAWITGDGNGPCPSANRLSGFAPGTPTVDVEVATRLYGFAGAHGFEGMWDAHHLRAHLCAVEGPLYSGDASQCAYDVVRSDDPRRVAIVVATFEDWPRALGQVSKRLEPGAPSWHAHVMSRRDGWLGTFRRCWHCNRWFQGPARFHLLGH